MLIISISMKWASNRKKRSIKTTGGFTIVELTIATLIFSTIIVMALASFIGIGRVYYKGRSLTETQAVAQQIVTQASGDIQFSSDVVTNYPTGTGIPTGASGSQYVCFGNIRYTYNLYQEVDVDDVAANHFGLLRDVMPGTKPCASPFGVGAIALTNPQELLAPKMRLSKFDVTPAKDKTGADVRDLWDMNVIIAYGSDDTLKNPGGANVACDAELKTSEFCSVSRQSTSVSRGL
jgi:type II secretory pathway pseudopilin PulG